MSDHDALIATRPGRPAVLDKDGCRIYIAVHDEFYRRRKADFKNRLKLAHPDMMPTRRVEVAAHPVKGYHSPATNRHGRFGTRWRDGYRRRPYSLRVRKTAKDFRRINAAYQQWLAEELTWYAAHGLTPPEWNGGKV